MFGFFSAHGPISPMVTSWPSPLAKDLLSVIRNPVKELLHQEMDDWKPEGVCLVTEV